MAPSRRDGSLARPFGFGQAYGRKPSCTHINVTRVWGNYHCWHCGRYPKCGWVFRCCVDWTPPGQPFKAATLQVDPESGTDLEILKPWMQKLAEQGDYTPEQVQILASQRREAMRAARRAERQHNCSVASPPKGSSPNSPLGSFRAQIMEIIKNMEDTPEDHAPASKPCTYQTCSQCRPSFSQRSWMSFNTLIAPSAKDLEHMQAELEFRPVSDVRVCRQLGTSYRRRFKLHDSPIEEIGEATGDNAATGKEIKRRNGQTSLRGSMGKTTATTGNQYHGEQRSDGLAADKAPRKRPKLWIDTSVGTKENKKLNLHPPIQIYPPVALEQSVTNEGAVKVSDGLAVTEEGVNTAMADIITQV